MNFVSIGFLLGYFNPEGHGEFCLSGAVSSIAVPDWGAVCVLGGDVFVRVNWLHPDLG